MHWIAVAAGGAFGAMARYAIAALYLPAQAGKIPVGTLMVNIIGSFLMGVCYVLIIERGALSPEWRSVLTAGFLGAFTTFSAFSLEAWLLWQVGYNATAATYVVISVVGCLLAVAAGSTVMARIF